MIIYKNCIYTIYIGTHLERQPRQPCLPGPCAHIELPVAPALSPNTRPKSTIAFLTKSKVWACMHDWLRWTAMCWRWCRGCFVRVSAYYVCICWVACLPACLWISISMNVRYPLAEEQTSSPCVSLIFVSTWLGIHDDLILDSWFIIHDSLFIIRYNITWFMIHYVLLIIILHYSWFVYYSCV